MKSWSEQAYDHYDEEREFENMFESFLHNKELSGDIVEIVIDNPEILKIVVGKWLSEPKNKQRLLEYYMNSLPENDEHGDR